MSMENLIIIGAGASCAHLKSPHLYTDYQYINPPAGKDLASNLRSFSQKWRTLETKYGVCGEDFEGWSQKLLDRNERCEVDGQFDYVWYLLILTNFFYKFDRIYNGSGYFSLLNALKAHLQNTVFVSLNYEILLELALKKRGYNIVYSSAAYEDSFNGNDVGSDVFIYKPHGSVNFRPKLNMYGDFKVCPINFSASANVHAGTHVVSAINENQKVCPSIISAYVPSKLTNLNFAFIHGVRSQLLAKCENCKKAIVIGVKANLVDQFMYKYFQTIFSNVKDVLLFCDKPAYNTYKELFPDVHFDFDYNDSLLDSPESYQRISKYLSTP